MWVLRILQICWSYGRKQTFYHAAMKRHRATRVESGLVLPDRCCQPDHWTCSGARWSPSGPVTYASAARPHFRQACTFFRAPRRRSACRWCRSALSQTPREDTAGPPAPSVVTGWNPAPGLASSGPASPSPSPCAGMWSSRRSPPACGPMRWLAWLAVGSASLGPQAPDSTCLWEPLTGHRSSLAGRRL